MSKYFDTAFFGLLVLMIISFPFSVALNSLLLAAFPLLFLLDYKNIKAGFQTYISSRRNILLLVLFLSLLISLLYSENKTDGLNSITGFLPLIALPLAMTRAGHLPPKKVWLLKLTHIGVCFIASGICLVLAFIRSGLTDSSYIQSVMPDHYAAHFAFHFTYHQLSNPLHLHAIYFSLFISLAVFFIIAEWNGSRGPKKFLLSVLLVYFLLVLILLKATVINFAMYSIWLIYFYVQSPFRKWHEYLGFFGLTLFATMVVSYLFTIKYFGNLTLGVYLFDSKPVNTKMIQAALAALTAAALAVAVKKIFKEKKTYISVILACVVITGITVVISASKKNNIPAPVPKDGEQVTNVNARFSTWVASWHLIKQDPFLGVGVGDQEATLIRTYEKMNYKAGVENRFDSHNQYLQFWIAGGIVAFLSFLLLLMNEIFTSVRRGHFIALAFSYCFTLFCVSEVVMHAQAGRIFFIFFLCLAGNVNFRPLPSLQNGKTAT